MSSPLLVRPSRPDADGRVHAVTPQSAGWIYVGFEVYDLSAGQTLTLVLMRGSSMSEAPAAGRQTACRLITKLPARYRVPDTVLVSGQCSQLIQAPCQTSHFSARRADCAVKCHQAGAVPGRQLSPVPG